MNINRASCVYFTECFSNSDLERAAENPEWVLSLERFYLTVFLIKYLQHGDILSFWRN